MKKHPRNLILFLILTIAFASLYLVGLKNSSLCPDDHEITFIIKQLRQRDPEAFWQALSEQSSQTKFNHCMIYTTLKALEHRDNKISIDDRISIDAVIGILLAHLQHYEHALPYLKHVVANSANQVETRRCLMKKLEIYETLGYIEDYKRITKQLKSAALAFRDPGSQNQAEKLNHKKNLDRLRMPYYLAVWFLLLIFPAAILEIERRNWTKKFEGRKDLRGPYIAFMYSPLCDFLILASSIVFLITGIPQKVGMTGRFFLLSMHIAAIWALCQYPLYLIESQVKKISYGATSYLVEKFRLLCIRNISATAAILSYAIVHQMVVNMPLWAIMRPEHAAIVLPAVFGLITLTIQFFLPFLFMLKPLKGENWSGRKVFLTVPGLRRGVFKYGSISFCNRIIGCAGIDNLLEPQELEILIKRSEKSLEKGWLFFDFMLTTLIVVATTLVIALNPLSLARFFATGPGFYQALFIFALIIPANIFRKHILKAGQQEIDIQLSKELSSSTLLKILEKTNALNYFPEIIREGDFNDFDLLSIEETRLGLRNAEGLFFPAISRPDCGVLISLWRSRLAIDWKLGEEEAIFLTSLDYSLTAENIDEELKNLALKHVRLGAECIYSDSLSKLEITECCQKFSAISAETPLPQQKICNICSQAMIKVLQFGPYTWQNTEKGCVLIRKSSPTEPQP